MKQIKLIADIGATNARFAVVQKGRIESVQSYLCANFLNFEDCLQQYINDIAVIPTCATLAVAGPVLGDQVSLTNLSWSFSVEQLKQTMNWDHLLVVNDFVAVAESIPLLQAQDIVRFGNGDNKDNHNIVVVGPGSGLGVAGLIWTGDRYQTVAGEGGNVTLHAHTRRQFDIFEQIVKNNPDHEYMAAEYALSGPGLLNLYQSICDLDGKKSVFDNPALIVSTATKKDCPCAVEALDLFCYLLGSVAGNLAITMGALSGVYIAGGIVPKLGDYFFNSSFNQGFEDKGRYRFYMESIPRFVITHPNPALLGLRDS